MELRTLFITSFNPFVTRNILFSDAFKVLSGQQDLQIIIFCPDYKKEYFERYFRKNNIVIEGVRTELTDRQDVIFGYLGRSLINTKTLAIHRKEIFLRNRNFLVFLISYFLSFVGYFSPIKKLVRFLDQATILKTKFAVYFEKYSPDLVFAADVFHVDDVHFLAEAKQRKIKTVGMVRSWDNITNKGLFRIKPNKLIVNNGVIKKEALSYEDIREKDIFVGGLPQFDFYIQQPRTLREEFFARIGLDPNKKTILVAPHGKRFYDADWNLLEILKSLPYQYIVRLPPNDSVNFGLFVPGKNFYIDDPGVRFKEGVYRDREMTPEDTSNLADELFYSDLVINYGSTITIDAAFFDKPVIIAAFDPEERKYLKSTRRFLDFSHISKMLKTDCCKVAYNKEGLLNYIESYLKNSELDKKGRNRLIDLQASRKDGQSGKAVADFIYFYVTQKKLFSEN